MKSDKHFRDKGSSDDLLKEPTRLEPNRKSGKDRIVFDEEEGEEIYRPEKESILDYFDDEED